MGLLIGLPAFIPRELPLNEDVQNNFPTPSEITIVVQKLKENFDNEGKLGRTVDRALCALQYFETSMRQAQEEDSSTWLLESERALAHLFDLLTPSYDQDHESCSLDEFTVSLERALLRQFHDHLIAAIEFLHEADLERSGIAYTAALRSIDQLA